MFLSLFFFFSLLFSLLLSFFFSPLVARYKDEELSEVFPFYFILFLPVLSFSFIVFNKYCSVFCRNKKKSSTTKAVKMLALLFFSCEKKRVGRRGKKKKGGGAACNHRKMVWVSEKQRSEKWHLKMQF
eukprot:TRINITY_DN4635_c1_g1_i2.p1 TRINITY_DN4635_c1_g1~~TRINITY_DN4635_c1_g1_i2.p1  ORF type:complete len:128 (+),score=5.47 TRINITY_DN4635_c1_g1_i2:20-403(+)